MLCNPDIRKPRQYDELSPEAKQTITEILYFHKTIDQFFNCEVGIQSNLFAPGLNMMTRWLYQNSAKGRKAYTRQYQRTLFD